MPFFRVQLHSGRNVSARRSGFESISSIGTLLSAPFPRSEACRVKGNLMRTLIQPPPSLHCDLCGGELRLKLIEPADATFDLENEVFVCANCGHEQSYAVAQDPHAPHPKVA